MRVPRKNPHTSSGRFLGVFPHMTAIDPLVCLCVLSSHSFLDPFGVGYCRRTSRGNTGGRSILRSFFPDFSLIVMAGRIRPSLSPSSTFFVSRILCTTHETYISFHEKGPTILSLVDFFLFTTKYFLFVLQRQWSFPSRILNFVHYTLTKLCVVRMSSFERRFALFRSYFATRCFNHSGHLLSTLPFTGTQVSRRYSSAFLGH